MKKQIVVIGLGRFGTSVAKTLYELGHDVMCIDSNERNVQDISPYVTHAVQADGTNEETLKELGVPNFDVAIVSIGERVEASVMATALLKRLNLPYIVAQATNDLHGSILEKIGADNVVYPEVETGRRVAHRLASPSVLDYMPLTAHYGICKMSAPPHFLDHTLAELQLGAKEKYGISVLAITRREEVILNPTKFERIEADDILVVVGNDDQIERISKEKGSAS